MDRSKGRARRSRTANWQSVRNRFRSIDRCKPGYDAGRENVFGTRNERGRWSASFSRTGILGTGRLAARARDHRQQAVELRAAEDLPAELC
jgi:hypothetical protein